MVNMALSRDLCEILQDGLESLSLQRLDNKTSPLMVVFGDVFFRGANDPKFVLRYFRVICAMML